MYKPLIMFTTIISIILIVEGIFSNKTFAWIIVMIALILIWIVALYPKGD